VLTSNAPSHTHQSKGIKGNCLKISLQQFEANFAFHHSQKICKGQLKRIPLSYIFKTVSQKTFFFTYLTNHILFKFSSFKP